MTGYALAVEKLGSNAKMQRCPAHADRTASLSVAEGEDGRALLYCFAGCSFKDIVAALDLQFSDLSADDDGVLGAVYVYRDEEGKPLFRVRRLQTGNPDNPKSFRQDRYEDGQWVQGLGTTRRVPYRLNKLIQSPEVWLTEGEKDAEAIIERTGAEATTFPGGASKWRDEYVKYFREKSVFVVGDNDEPGRKSAALYRMKLESVASEVMVFYPPAEYKDVAELLMSGGDLVDLMPEALDLDPFAEMNWSDVDVQPIEWILEPYVPKAARVLAFGAAGSLKSLWALWLAARVTRQGGLVAYFSLEMQPSEVARRLRSLAPGPGFRLFTQFSLESPEHVDLATRAFKGYDLIIIDSFSAAYPRREDNAAIAVLDNEVYQPIIEATGATILIIDNVGLPSFGPLGKQQPDWARGASAKGDKMEMTLYFRRPLEEDNYRSEIAVKKVRIDYPVPPRREIFTPREVIEFYYQDGDEVSKMWPDVGAADENSIPDAESNPVAPAPPERPKRSPEAQAKLEELMLKKLKEELGAVEIEDERSEM